MTTTRERGSGGPTPCLPGHRDEGTTRATTTATTTPTTTATRSPDPAPAGRCSLRLRITGIGYRVRPIEALSRDAGVVRAFRLKRVGAEPTTIAETIEGPVCDCGDFIFRHDGNGSLCKHLRAARACGLL